MTKRQTTSRRRGKGSITSYQTKAGTRWRYQVWVPADPEFPDGEYKHVGKGGYLTADAADDAMQDARGKQRAGVDLSAAMPIVADYSRRWLDGLDLEAATVAGYRRIFALHVNPAIGAVRLDKVSSDPARQVVRRSSEAGPVAETVTLWAFEELHTQGPRLPVGHVRVGPRRQLAGSNPARKRKTVKAPTTKAIKREQEEMSTWTGAQLRAFLTWDRDTLKDDVHTLWWLIAHTGLRRSEVLALRWADVDFDGQRIRVRRALDTGLPAARRAEVKGTKSGRARVVDVDTETVKMLKRWRSERASLALDFTRADAVVFGTLDGSPRNPISLSQMFSRRVAKARQALGFDALPEITLHGLRHTHATVLLEAGENPKVVQERLGHTTFATTMDIYSHVTPTMQRSAVDRFAAAVSGTE